MPYHIEQDGNKFKVVVDATGKVVGTHPSKAQAQAQLGALYANVPDVQKLILTGGDGWYIEFNTPDCQHGWAVMKSGTAQSSGCYLTKEEAERALEGLNNKMVDLIGPGKSQGAQTPHEYASGPMNKCLTCGCGEVENDHGVNKPTISFWDGVFSPTSKGQMGPEFNAQDQDARYYFPSKATYENDGKPSAGYGNRSSNQAI